MSTQSPWFNDASKFEIKNEDNIVKNNLVDDFLNDDRKLFIVAPKGMGKTLLLSAKSIRFKNRQAYVCLPRNRLVFGIWSVRATLSFEELVPFQSQKIWEKVWMLALCTVIINGCKKDIDIPSELKELVQDSDDLNYVFSSLITNGKQVIEKLLSKNIDNILLNAISHLQGVTQIAVFIDSIDETLIRDFYDDHEMWVNCQVALMLAIRQICQSNNHVKIYSSIQGEAYNQYTGLFKRQLDAFCTEIKYSKSELLEIFETYINLTPVDRLSSPNSDDPCEMFIGFKNIEHPFANNLASQNKEEHDVEKIIRHKEEPVYESAFDFLIRHTLMRPRELVSVGEHLYGMKNEDRMNSDTFRQVVNDEGNKFVQEYLKETGIDIIDVKRFCELIQKNVLPYNFLNTIDDKESLGFLEDMTETLWRLGVIGWVEPKSSMGYKQKFNKIGAYFKKGEERIPKNAEYLISHPTLDRIFQEVCGENFRDKTNIIEDGRDFNMPSTIDGKPSHVHIGSLRRDALSIIFPEHVKYKSIAAVQFPIPETKLNFTNTFSVNLNLVSEELENENYHYTFQVVHDDLSTIEATAHIEDWKNGRKHILLYSRNPLYISEVMNHCITITGFKDMFNPLNNFIWEQFKPSVRVYAYVYAQFYTDTELYNYNNIVKNLGLTDNLTVTTSIIDRFTFDYLGNQGIILDYNLKNANIRLNVEKDCQIICREREGAIMLSTHVMSRTNSTQHKYYLLRALYIKEATYRLIKVYRKLQKIDVTIPIQDVIQFFTQIQLHRMFERISPNQISEFTGGGASAQVVSQLEAYAQSILHRVLRLDKRYFGAEATEYIEASKETGIFPNQEEYFKYSAYCSLFQTRNDIPLFLQNELLRIPLFSGTSVFISYRHDDRAFAMKFGRSLEKRGVKKYLYAIEGGSHKPLHEAVKSEVNNHNVAVLLISQLFLKSELCHIELQEIRSRLESNEMKVAVLLLDNYALNVELSSLPADLLAMTDLDCEGNIAFLKNFSMDDVSKYNNSEVTKDFEDFIDDKILRFIKRE